MDISMRFPDTPLINPIPNDHLIQPLVEQNNHNCKHVHDERKSETKWNEF